MPRVRVATFNVENLFERSKAMNLPTWGEGQPYIDAANAINKILNRDKYTAANKRKLLELLEANGLLATRSNNSWLELRKIRGQLFSVPKSGPAQIVANGRKDWIGWIDLKREQVDDPAIDNTARVLEEVDADVYALVEIESRPALENFYEQAVAPRLEAAGKRLHPFNMLIDGNDQRGIDVAILSRFPILSMRSHITDLGSKGTPVFARDCPVYILGVRKGVEIAVLPNHFTSQGSAGGGKARRREQSARVAQIYRELRKDYDHVIVAGDLNENPKGGNLAPLIDSTDLVDVMSLPAYEGLPGTYKTATATNKLDYLLVSPALRKVVTKVDVFRKGYYAPTKWEGFDNITAKTKHRYQASDHHCVWADFDL